MKKYVDVAREAFAYYAADADTQHLLAILIGPRATPETCGRLASIGIRELAEMSVPDLMKEGLTAREAERIVSAFALGRKLANSPRKELSRITNPRDAANYLMGELRYLKQEHFVVLFLDTKNQVISHETIFIGDLHTTVASPKEIFRAAMRRHSASIICFHNHPSGDPTPSREDVAVTRRLMEVGEAIGIEVLDHIIIGDGCYVSMKERGLV